MEDKILTTDSTNAFSNGAALGAMLNRGNGDAAAMMANQFGNNWMNNPFAYLMFMMIPAVWGGGNGFGGNNATSAQLQALQTQIADNHNSDLAQQALQGNRDAVMQLAQNFNVGIGQVTAAIAATQQAISAGLCNVRNGITEANGNIALSAERMIANNNLQSAAIGSQMCQGFNGVQRDILSQGYQNQIGNLQQSNLLQLLNQQQSQLISNGFTQLGFQAERDACSVRENSTANTQKIIDTLNAHWNGDLQTENAQLKAQLAMAGQTQQLLAAINSSASATAVKTVSA